MLVRQQLKMLVRQQLQKIKKMKNTIKTIKELGGRMSNRRQGKTFIVYPSEKEKDFMKLKEELFYFTTDVCKYGKFERAFYIFWGREKEK